MVATKLTTAEDLARLPGDERYELIRGVLHPMSPNGRPHGRMLTNLTTPLHLHNRKYGIGTLYVGDVGVFLERDPDTVLAPDISFVRGAAVPLASEGEGFILVIPDLVIEIASPSDTRKALRDKAARYLEAGVPHVWLVEFRTRSVSLITADGKERVLTEADVIDGGEVLPGFRLAVADIFR